MSCCALLPFLLLAADVQGIRPRAAADSYPAQATASAGLKLGAEVLGLQEVRNTFATDLNRGYLVVEVGLFPADGKPWDVTLSDFSLRIGSDKMVRAVSGRTIASILQQKRTRKGQHQQQGPADVTIYPSATIGYETAGGLDNRVDPDRRDRRRGGGWYGGGGVGVGVGGASAGPPMDPSVKDANRSTMELELTEKGLPEGEVSRPTAGYLYFPLADAKASSKVAYELQYQPVAGDRARVELKSPTRK